MHKVAERVRRLTEIAVQDAHNIAVNKGETIMMDENPAHSKERSAHL